MATLQEWLECRTVDGQPLHQEKCDAYRRRRGLQPLNPDNATTAPPDHASKKRGTVRVWAGKGAAEAAQAATGMVATPAPQSPKASHVRSLECPHRGAPIREEKADLCGYRGKTFEVLACAKFGECAIGRFWQRQTVRSCAVCIAAGENG